jgi:hypothetical protein
MTHSIEINESTRAGLQELAGATDADPSRTASRLLARVVRAAMPRPTYDIEAIKLVVAEFEGEEIALAESDLEHRLALLEAEDRA